MLAQMAARTHPSLAVFDRMRSYRHPVLINKMMAELELKKEEAEELLDDVKRFLSLPGRGMAPTEAVDKGWHLFILFTADYEAFCMKFLGRFVHHIPEDPFRVRTRRDFEAVPRTMALAQEIFGELSANWSGTSTCSGSGCMNNCKR